MLKARQQIDVVLKYMYDIKDEVTAMDIEAIKANQNLLKIATNKYELERMILKLRNDKNIQLYPDYPLLPDGKKDMRNGLLNYCTITFNGRLFWEDGGYEGEYIRNENKESTIHDYNLRMETYTKRLSTWTERLTYGTVVAALILVSWEMIKTFLIENCR